MIDGLDRNLIDGELRAASSGTTFATLNPATEEELGQAADGTAADLDAAIGAARRAFDETDWSTDHAFRAHCVRQLRDAMVANADELRELTIAEVGAPRFLTTLAQLDSPVADLGYVADLAESYEWTRDLGEATPVGIPSHRWVLREAAGVVGAITPWNFPHQINLAKLGPALAAGCTVVLKPAPDTPWAAAALGAMATETDLPPGVLNIVNSSDHALGAALAQDPRVDLVSFTGSTATGRKVMAGAAETLKRVFLELGGKSAFIILDDADLGSAASLAAFTACTHAGQGCAITTRLLVPRARYDEAVEATAATMAALGAGDPQAPGTICGPLISARQRERVEGYLQLALRRGRHLRHRRRATGRARPRVLRGANVDHRARQLRPRGPRGDLRAGAGGDRPRRRRRRRAHRQRLALRPVRRRPQRRCRAGLGGRPPGPHRHHERERRRLVRRRRALRRLQGLRHRPGDGRGRLRGVPGDQVGGRGHLTVRSRRDEQGDDMGRFDDKVAIVTGAAGGIGEAYARALAAEGASVVVADLDERGEETAASITAAGGGEAAFVRVDVSSPESTAAMAAATIERFGGIDHLVNNAAIYGGMEFDLLLTVDWDYYRRFMGVNMDGALLCTRACYESMAARGGGSIVNQSSTAAWLYSGFYGLAKVGVNGLTQQLAHELGGRNIRINAIAPGPTDTAATRAQVGEDYIKVLVKDLALKRPGQPEDMVGMCLFLLSAEASWVTGQIFNVDGGQVFRS